MKKVRRFIRKHEKKLFAIDAVIILALAVFLGSAEMPSKVKGLEAESTFASADLAWQKSENADGYRIFKSSDGRHFEYIDSTVDTKYKDSNLTTGSTYYYAVAARNGLKRTEISSADAVKVIPSLETPVLKVDTSKGNMELNISEVKGATAYEIIRDGVSISKSEDTKFIDNKAKLDVAHKYEVKAIRDAKKSKSVSSKTSNSIKAELHQIPGFEIKATEDEISINWDENDYYSSYKIYNGDNLLGETEETTFTVSDYDMDKTYDIKLVGMDAEEKLQSPKEEERFKIEEAPLDNDAARQAAVDWALEIAADDSFTYGAAPASWHCGCYFCGTNVRSKGAGYEKTYCCNPFVNAAYAHGAGDPEILRLCQRGGSLGMKESDYYKYGDWSNVGKPSMGDLEPGDVLIAPSHVMMYKGDGEIVHAAHSGWGPETITTDNCSSFYGIVKYVMRYQGTGSGTMYKVVEVDKNDKPINAEDE